jgi:uncharacterized protein
VIADPSVGQVLVLAAVALLAGLVDAIAGGGGLLTLPALLSAGVPPHLALGTNKGQSVFGSLAALIRYTRAGLVDRRQARLALPLGLLGALAGAQLVLWVRPEVLRPVVLALLVAVAVFVAVRRGPSVAPVRPAVRRERLAVATIALGIGAYDGFFGPGTGTFLIAAFVGRLGHTLSRATADAKVVNFASNAGALALFGSSGLVLWRIALPMAAAQLVGGWLGAHLAVRGGDRLIRGVVLVVVLGLVLKLGAELLG